MEIHGSIKKPELLAPAGNFAKLKTAFMYGADAVYLGGEYFGLRAQADNFTEESIGEAVRLADSLGKKIYVTVNIIARDNDLDAIAKYAVRLAEAGVHGVIIADIGTFMLIRETVPELPVHVSTQANNLNWRTVKFWFDNGASRVNLARELSFDEIAAVNEKLIKNCDKIRNMSEHDEPYLEAFVHGAMCMSFSGRCMLSDYMTGRSSNRGDCAQPCRWNYYIAEEKRPGQYMPVFENSRGTFIFNSKDLCMIEYLPEFLKCGVGSLKIEGRMKSEFYTAVTVRAYRIAIDEFCKNPDAYIENKALKEELLSELCSVSHRDYSTGFYLGRKGEQIYSTSSYMRDTDFIGAVEDCSPAEDDTGRHVFRILIRVRGAFDSGDLLEFVIPGKRAVQKARAEIVENDRRERISRAASAMMAAYVYTAFEAAPGSIVRKRKSK